MAVSELFDLPGSCSTLRLIVAFHVSLRVSRPSFAPLCSRCLAWIFNAPPQNLRPSSSFLVNYREDRILPTERHLPIFVYDVAFGLLKLSVSIFFVSARSSLCFAHSFFVLDWPFLLLIHIASCVVCFRDICYSEKKFVFVF